MVKISEKQFFPSLPPTTRATALVLGADPKGKNFLYCTSNSVLIRDIENPVESDSYYDHQKPPTCAKYSPSGYYICSGDSIGNVRIWDTTQKEHLTKYEYRPISGQIRDIAWDADSKRIAVCGDGRENYAHAFLWDSGSSLGRLDKIMQSANSVDIKKTRPYRCAVASEDCKTYLYEGPPFKFKVVFDKGTRFSNCARYSPDGKYLVTCNSDGNIFLLDGKTSEYIGKFGGEKAHKGGVYSVCFNGQGTELLSASADKTCKIWDVESREMLVEFVLGTTIDDQQLGCLWQNDHLISVSLSGEIKFLDRENPNTPKMVLSGHNKSITSCTVKPNEAIFTASFDGNIVKWEPETGASRRLTGKGHGATICGLVFNPETNRLISAGNDNKIRFADPESCEFVSENVIGFDSQPFAIDITSSGDVVVACQKELALIRDGKKVSSFALDQEDRVVMAAQGSNIIACFGGAYHVYAIDGSSITETKTKFAAPKIASSLAFSPDGTKLAVVNEKTILIYDVVDGFENEPKELDGHRTRCTFISWSPDSRHLASSSIDATIFVWDVLSKKKDSAPRSHDKTVVSSVAWLNENTVITTGEDSTVKQWNVEV